LRQRAIYSPGKIGHTPELAAACAVILNALENAS